MKYQDSKVPLDVAKRKFEENELKDCAMSCRRAVECITGKLWKQVVQCYDGGITVKLRGLQGSPDLHTVTSALYEHTKPGKIEGT